MERVQVDRPVHCRDQHPAGSLGKAQMMLATRVHAFLGMLVLYRCLVIDAMCLLPRNPITWILGNGLVRTVYLSFPSTMGALKWFVDADQTPVLLLVTLVSLSLSGGLNKTVLWRPQKMTRFITLVLFFIAPAVWLHKTLHVLGRVEAVKAELRQHFHDVELPHSNMTAEYDLKAHLQNHLGGDMLWPDLTAQYKQTEPLDATSCNSDPSAFAVIGDHFNQARNRAQMGNGVLELDVFKPQGELPAQLDTNSGLAPIVVFIHGGGWKRGDRNAVSANFAGGAPRYLVNSGYMLVSVTYRLACLTGIQAKDQIQDVQDSLAYIKEHAAEWGGDGSRMVLWGASAGGHLALMSGYTSEMPEIRGVVSYYGVTQLQEDLIREGAMNLFEKLHALIFVKETRLICDHHEKDHRCWKDISPVNHANKAKPTMIMHGNADAVVNHNQARWLRDELHSHIGQDKVTYVEVPCGAHDCDVHCSTPCGQLSLFALERFLFRHFSPLN